MNNLYRCDYYEVTEGDELYYCPVSGLTATKVENLACRCEDKNQCASIYTSHHRVGLHASSAPSVNLVGNTSPQWGRGGDSGQERHTHPIVKGS